MIIGLQSIWKSNVITFGECKIKRPPFPQILDTTGYRLYWNDTEVSEVEYKKLEQEALEHNEKLARDKAELDVPAKRKRKSSTK